MDYRSPYLWMWVLLGGAIAYIVFVTYRDAVRERRERRERKPQLDAVEAKLRAAYREWKGRQK